MVESNGVHQNECNTGVPRHFENICISIYLTAIYKAFKLKSNVALPCILSSWVCQAFSLRNCCCLNTFTVPSDLQHRPYRYPDVLPSFVIKVGFLQVLCQGDNAKATEPEKCVETIPLPLKKMFLSTKRRHIEGVEI
jgi:hypothetical protein